MIDATLIVEPESAAKVLVKVVPAFAAKVVKAAVDLTEEPIAVPSIVPPLISAVVTDPKSVQVAPAAVGVPVIVGESIVGELPKTTDPEPVSSDNEAARSADAPLVTKFFEASVNTALEAVNPEKLIVPDEEIPVAPVIAPAPEISKVAESKILSQPNPTFKAVSVPFEVEIAPINKPLVDTPEAVVEAGVILIPFKVPEVDPAGSVTARPVAD